MADFAKVKKESTSYPQANYAGQENQSFGFLDARKLQTGTLRGQQAIGIDKVKIDSVNNRLTVSDGTDIRIGLGQMPDGTYQLVITKTGYDLSEVFN